LKCRGPVRGLNPNLSGASRKGKIDFGFVHVIICAPVLSHTNKKA